MEVMTMEYFEIQICIDCAHYIANDEIGEGVDANAIRAGIARECGDRGHIAIGEPCGFHHRDCELCQSSLAGDRYFATLCIPAPLSDE